MRRAAGLVVVFVLLLTRVFAQSDSHAVVIDAPENTPPAQTAPQRPPPGLPDRVFLSTNLSSVHRHAGRERYTLTKTMYGEPAIGTATYRTPPRTSVAIPLVNVALSRHLLVGVRVAWPEYENRADLSLQLPHPVFANQPGTGTDVADLSRRKDVVLDLMATYLVDRSPWVIQVFGGPTYFATSQERIRGMNYRHSLGTNIVTITEVLRETVTGAGWGANAGVDFSYYMWPHLGVGAGTHVNFGRIIMVEEPLTGEPGVMPMGSTTWNGGIRVRF
jgi:hypothetical protein